MYYLVLRSSSFNIVLLNSRLDLLFNDQESFPNIREKDLNILFYLSVGGFYNYHCNILL